MARVKAFTDGASRGNPGEAGMGVIIYDEKDRVVLELGDYLGVTTNNVAEYKALLAALKEAKHLGASEIEVFADSELMVKQIKGLYQVKNEGLLPLYREAKKVIGEFQKFQITHVLRSANKEADRLANAGIDAKGRIEKRLGEGDGGPVATASIVTAPVTAPDTSPDTASDTAPAIPLDNPPAGNPVTVPGGDFPEVEIAPGLVRKVLAVGPSLMTVEFRFQKGAAVPPHRHRHEQVSYVVRGKLKFTVEGREIIVRAGESIAVPSQAEHAAEALEDTLDIDVFTPVREDFL